MVLLSYVAWPTGDVEVVGEVAHEGDGRCDGQERTTTQRCGSYRQCTTLALSLGKELVHVAGLTGGHKVDGPHYIHIGATVVVSVLVAELVGKPVTVGVGKVLLDAVGTISCRAVVDALATGREIELGIVLVVVAARTVGYIALTARGIAAVVAQIVHDDGMLLAVGGLSVVAANDDGVAADTVGYRLHLYQIYFTVGSTLSRNLRQRSVDGCCGQLFFGRQPIAVEVVLLVGCRYYLGGLHGKVETTGQVVIDACCGMIDACGGYLVERHHNLCAGTCCHLLTLRGCGHRRHLVGSDFYDSLCCYGLAIGIAYADGKARGCISKHPVVGDGHAQRQRLQLVSVPQFYGSTGEVNA